MMNKRKSLIRATNRSGTASGKSAPAERATGRPAEPTVCERCGAVFSGRAWRRPRAVSAALLDRAVWRQCPACKQIHGAEYWGRVIVRGGYALANEAAIRQRVRNVAARAESTQPERRLVSVEREGTDLEVLTTSQKLAHRIVHELKKTFRGRASYKWSDDGSLFAVWERD
jgi:NMD protein affecting ribosome stability and mRNA decay